MKKFFNGFFVVLIILGAGLLIEFLYFGLLGSKSNPHKATDTIFILNGDSERIKKGYEQETEVGGRWSVVRSLKEEIGGQTTP